MNTKPITDKEASAALKLAGRAVGVTRAQLAEKLKIGYARARAVLNEIQSKKANKIAVEPKGEGKDSRTLVYKAGVQRKAGANKAKTAAKTAKSAKKRAKK